MSQFKDFGIRLAEKAGEEMRKNFALELNRSWKHDNTLVTETDIAINKMVISSIQKTFPEHSILGEEISALTHSEFTWVCDPIDGTIPFASGIPLSTFSLALTQNGESIFGVVYDPFMDRMCVAEKGKGTFLNNKQVYVSKNNILEKSIMSLNYWKSKNFDLFALARNLDQRDVKIMRLNATVYGGLLTAFGEFIGVINAGNVPWDVAALAIIIKEAGGTCTDMNGKDQKYNKSINGFVGTNGVVHNEILEMIKTSC
jgi:fructose-1,6-bisphosphatase/inositol monophosphatase family enzyme